MPKLKPTETARVLHSALGCISFTVDELAKRTSANPDTVRTILFRSKSWLEEVPERAPPPEGEHSTEVARERPAGRPGKRYRLTPSARENLSVELAQLTAPARDRPADTSAEAEAALTAAESSLELTQDPESASTGTDWALQARGQARTARRLLPSVHDPRARERLSKRLAMVEAQFGTSERAQTPEAPWLKQLRDFFHAAGEGHSPAMAGQMACLWFDATQEKDPWTGKVVAELRGAHCEPVRMRVEDVLQEGGLRGTEITDLMRALGRDLPVIVTMRSAIEGTHEEVLQLLEGPLRSVLRAGAQAHTRAPQHAPPVTVLDHDLAPERFWLDHGIENLRYYPTATPMLAGRLIDSVFAAGSRTSPLEVEPEVPEFPPAILPGDHLSTEAAAMGFAALEAFSQRLHLSGKRPTVLVGVNRGGYLLAQMLWSRRQMKADALIKCECDPRTQALKLERDIPSNVGSLILIDDVVRTGRTMRVVREVLRQRYPGSRQLLLALTAVSADYQGGPLPYEMDFCAWISRDPKLKFPWSGKGRDPNPSTYLDTTGVNQIGGWLRGSVQSELAVGNRRW